jgi:hypothetical protein
MSCGFENILVAPHLEKNYGAQLPICRRNQRIAEDHEIDNF